MIQRLFQSIGLANDVSPSKRRADDRLDLGEIESLESREMLAGNVDVFINRAGDVRIVGDDADNSVNITGLSSSQIITAPGTSLRLNGQSTSSVVIEERYFSRNLTIDMNDGDDSVFMANVRVSGNLRIQLDRGADELRSSSGAFQKNVTIHAGAGFDADTVSVFGEVDGNLSINMGSAAEGRSDRTVLSGDIDGNLSVVGTRYNHSVNTFAMSVDGNARFSTGAGDDFVELKDSTFRRNLNLVTGSGGDIAITNDNLINGNSRFSLGSGDDEMYREVSTFNGLVRFVGGSGQDELWTGFSDQYTHPNAPTISQFESENNFF